MDLHVVTLSLAGSRSTIESLARMLGLSLPWQGKLSGLEQAEKTPCCFSRVYSLEAAPGETDEEG